MRLFHLFCLSLLFSARIFPSELETRMHRFEYASPELVERQIRGLVPEGPRVSVNARAKQVIVIADAQTQEKIASMLNVLGRPPRTLSFLIRHNREDLRFSIADGVPLSLPVSQTPPEHLVDIARLRLAPEIRNLPVVGSAFQAHVVLLRENPAVLRLRLVPAVIFGSLQPYKVVKFEDVAMDVMVNTEEYVELQEKVGGHDFYRQYLLTQPDPAAPPRPVSLVVSFEGVEYGSEEPVDGN